MNALLILSALLFTLEVFSLLLPPLPLLLAATKGLSITLTTPPSVYTLIYDQTTAISLLLFSLAVALLATIAILWHRVNRAVLNITLLALTIVLGLTSWQLLQSNLPIWMIPLALLAASLLISLLKQPDQGQSRSIFGSRITIFILWLLLIFAVPGYLFFQSWQLKNQLASNQSVFYFPAHLPTRFPPEVFQTNPATAVETKPGQPKSIFLTYGPIPGKRYPAGLLPGSFTISEVPRSSPQTTGSPTGQIETVAIPTAINQKGTLETILNSATIRSPEYRLEFTTRDNIFISIHSTRLTKDTLLSIANSIQ